MAILTMFATGALIALGMAWKTGWSLVLGFALSAALQCLVPAQDLRDALGRDDWKAVAIAGAAGAASSSCSYASTSIMRTLFKKGAALAPSLAFLLASTNLVLELGVVLWLLMGWRFMIAEWLGAVVMIAIMVPVVRICVPASLVRKARAHGEAGRGHDHAAQALHGRTWRERLRDPAAAGAIGRTFSMEWRMLWKDLALGFTIGGMLAEFVPDHVWQVLFLAQAPHGLRSAADVLIGPLAAMLTFVCSIGNVPLAAMLWSAGAGFGGVIAFLYGDLIILPLLDAYRRYFGWRMALAIGTILYVSMALGALVVSFAFGSLGLEPSARPQMRAGLMHFGIDYNFFLNLAAVLLAGWLLWMGRAKHATDEG